MNEIRYWEIFEVKDFDGYFFDEDMCDGSADANFYSFFLLEVISSNEIRMIFPFKIELSLMPEFFLIDSIDFMFLDMDMAIMIVLPKCDLIGIGFDHSPFFGIKVLGILLLVSHLYLLILVK